VLTATLGLACAAILDRAGHRMAGLLCCALTGVLVSPISWDHHWVWIIPGVVVAAHYAVRARNVVARRAYAGLAAGIVLVFGAWPKSLWSTPPKHPGFAEGFIWAPPNTDPSLYYRRGDRASYAEYHWHGLYLIAGNLYVLAGMALFVMLLVFAARAAWDARKAWAASGARTALAAAAGGPAVPSASG
jgi:alpha-1,2-mannosyltransferase